MTPTICSGKTRQARSDMRHVRRVHINPALSDVVSCDNKRPENHRVSPPLCSGAQSQQQKDEDDLMSPTQVSNIDKPSYEQLLLDISDNAVTSSTIHSPSSTGSDWKNRCLPNDSSHYTNSNTDTWFSSPSINSQNSCGHYDENDDIYDDFMSTVTENEEEEYREKKTKGEICCETDSRASCDMVDRREKLPAKQSSNNKVSNLRSTEGLLSIAIKTIKLVKRNNRLQQRLTQLQLETSEFIQSVLSNQENRHFRVNIRPNGVREVDNV